MAVEAWRRRRRLRQRGESDGVKDDYSDADGAGIIFVTGGGMTITGAVYMFISASRITTLYSFI